MKLDHLAIVVDDLDGAVQQYKEVLGINNVMFETVETEKVRIATLIFDNCRLELMQPTDSDSPIQKFLDKRGSGLHHMALETADIDKDVERMKGYDIKFLGNIRSGAEGTKIAFIHPKSLYGVLTELRMYPKDDSTK